MPIITGKTKLLGVMGYPIEHSLSPVMHNAALESLGLDYIYLPLPVQPENLGSALAGLTALGWQGFNVTIPHKQAVLPLLTHTSDLAQAIGAVNTVWQTEAGWNGTNTDVIGFLAPLQPFDRDWSQVTALVLGSGGAARAVVAACTQLGCGAVQVVGRDRQKLTAFQQSWIDSPLSPQLTVHPWETLVDLLPQVRLLVNTTPLGMSPYTDQSPLRQADLAVLPPDVIVYDLIYNPRPTLLLREAQERGMIALDGLEMLVQQGAAAFQIWLQHAPPIEVMRQALLRQLD